MTPDLGAYPGGAAAGDAAAGDGGHAGGPRSPRDAGRWTWTRARSAKPPTIWTTPCPTIGSPAGVAHPGLLLRQANRALAENVALGAWIHVSSDVTHLGLARAGDRLETRGRVARVYERGGRGWVDLDLLLVVPDAARPIACIRHTAIYRLDGGASA